MSEKLIGIMIFILIALTACAAVRYIPSERKSLSSHEHTEALAGGNGGIRIVIDAGHGGFDPGKIGVNGIEEKDINLSIAYKLKNLLEQNDIEVVMTRTDDSGLYGEGDKNKKAADMKKRVSLIESSDATLTVSIHQNSYTSESVHGAQVFYYGASGNGKALAESIQNCLAETLKDGNKRKIKSNDSYYLLKKAPGTVVIVECGFLSNNAEASLLADENYQEKLAWSIHMGILRFLNKASSSR